MHYKYLFRLNIAIPDAVVVELQGINSILKLKISLQYI